MEKPKRKGLPVNPRHGALLLAAGMGLGVLVTGLAVLLLSSSQAAPPPPVPTAIPFTVLMPSPIPTDALRPQATVIAPRVGVAAVAPNGRSMAVAAWDNGRGTLALHDFAVNANLTGDITPLPGDVGLIDDIHFSPDGARLVALSESSQSVWLYDVATRGLVQQFSGASEAVFTPDGRSLLLAGPDGLRRLRLADLTEESRLPGQGYIYHLALSPDGEHLALALENPTAPGYVLEIRRLADWNAPPMVYVLNEPVTALAFHPSGRYLALTQSLTLRVYDLVAGAQHYYDLPGIGRARAVAFSPQGDWLAVAGGEGSIGVPPAILLWVWTADSPVIDPNAGGQQVLLLSGHSHDINSLSFTPDNAYLLSAASDGSVRLWDYRSGLEVSRLQI